LIDYLLVIHFVISINSRDSLWGFCLKITLFNLIVDISKVTNQVMLNMIF